MDLALDLKTWQIKAIVVSLHKNVAEELGMNRILRKTRIPIEASLVMGIGDIITLQVSKSQLKEMLLQKTGKKNEGPKPTPS
jgi:sporulation protein YlmC with PRC-barrel domain